ncbi:MAG: aldehyde:ferredoxin oxidoreductase [Firmicutes bacterium]|nr:aldehyde:ferredoxin oxidoreductase [Bacillota bacterium]
MSLPRYLLLDLTRKTSESYPVSEMFYRTYLGGKALAARILLAETKPGLDPLAPEMPLIVNTGPLTGTGAPASGRFNVTTKNVLTGGIASSNCGGNFGFKLRKAGWDGIIIRGRAEQPVYIEISEAGVKFHDARELWGKDTEQTQAMLPRQAGKLVIGPAGENLVHYASIVSQERVAGRCGVGAVMGAKNLKAVIAHGTADIPMSEPEKFRKFNRRWLERIRANKLTGEALPRYGTMGFISKGSTVGLLPVRNFSDSSFKGAENISGERYAETLLTRNFGCIACPIRCGRRQMIGDREVKGPEYETVGLLGANLDNDNLELIGRWNYTADLMGLDTISLGGTLGFAMELQARGLADLCVEFGKTDNINALIEDIAHRRGPGEELANGSRWLAEKYGGAEFAPHVKGMELPAYDPRRSVGLGLGYATSNRGACHLNGGYMVFLEALGPVNVNPQTAKGKAALTVLMQNMMEAISLSGVCLFTSMALFPNSLHRMRPSGALARMMGKTLERSAIMLGPVNRKPSLMKINTSLVPYPKALQYVTGIKMNLGAFLRAGEAGYNLERVFNLREGLKVDDDMLNERFLSTPQIPEREETIVPLADMLPAYYRNRGWDEAGAPTAAKLSQLGISDGDY